MSFNSWISILSLIIALLALAVAAWQARQTARLTLNAHKIQVIADAFREIRSTAFLEHYRRILSFPKTEKLAAGFESLPRRRKESAYAVCYFFEHLGVLVARELIPGDVLIPTMRTLIILSWDALKNAIDEELEARKSYPEKAGHDFLPHFKELVRMAESQQYNKSATVARLDKLEEPADRAALRQTGDSALTHAANNGTRTPMRVARSGHTPARSLAKNARASAKALARPQAERDPARRP